jgi:uncharacterized protein (TIGR03067 family)
MQRFLWSMVLAVMVFCLALNRGHGDDKDVADKELKQLEGNWQLARQETRGSLTPKPIVERLRIVIEGNEISWYIGNPAANQTADLKVDPKQAPKTIEAEITSGSAKDKIMLGIYKLEKDTLEICWGEPGSDKLPKKFTSRPGVGSGNVFERYEREKEK